MNDMYFYTDGACSNNGSKDAKGGWAYVAVKVANESVDVRIKKGSKESTTNNEMELTAVYMALVKALKDGYKRVTIFSDSAYVVNAITKGWLLNWYNNDWRTAEDKPVKNKNIWEKMFKLVYTKKLTIKMVKVAGHKGDPLNELADKCAVKAREELEG